VTALVLARQERALRVLALLLACCAGAVAVLDPKLVLFGTAAIAFTAIAFTNLAAGVAAFAFLSFFEQLPGGASVPGHGRLAGVVLVIAALRRAGAPLLIREHPVVGYLSLLFIGWAAASVLWAREPALAAVGALQLAFGVALVFVVFAAVRELRHTRWIIWGYVAGGVTSALVGLTTISSVPASEPVDAGRLSGGIGDPNELAAFLVPVVALATFGFAGERGLLERWLLLSSIAVSGLAIMLTLSRGGYVAFGAMLLIALVAAGSMRPTAFVLVLAVAGIGLGYFTFAASPQARERITHFTSGGGGGRTDIWSVALEAAADNPFTGVGAGNFRSVEPAYGASARVNLPNVELVVDRPRVVHNTFLEMVVELGLIGGLAFVLLLAALLAPAVRAWRSFERARDRRMELLSRGLVIGTLGMLVAFLFVSGQSKEQLWILLGLAIALGSLASPKPVLRRGRTRMERRRARVE